jgi:hypothetical protein
MSRIKLKIKGKKIPSRAPESSERRHVSSLVLACRVFYGLNKKEEEERNTASPP